MTDKNVIIYKLKPLYHILEELSLNLNLRVFCINSENSLVDKIDNLNNCIIISNKKNLNFLNLVILDNLPVSIFKLAEKINIKFLKLKFSSQSQVKINNYIIDLNSRQMILNITKLKLTEKEINIIIYLSKVDKPVSVDELQKNVWSYQSNIETHTVETHIYRLRKKILNNFDDNEFIMSKKNGYQIK